MAQAIIKPIRPLVIGARIVNGRPNIGAELVSRLKADLWQPPVIVRSKSYQLPTENFVRTCNPNDQEVFRGILADTKPNVVFIAIPTADDGQTELAYTLASLHTGAKVVTAAKGMAASLFGGIAEHLDDVDIGAAVGGGNRFVYHPKLQYLDHGRRVTIYGILNATCSFLGWQLGEGISEHDAVEQAQQRGIAEPAKPGMILTLGDLFRGEKPDKKMKVCALYNMLLARGGRYLLPTDFKEAPFGEEEISRLISPHEKRRLIVTITNQPGDANHHRDVIGLMEAEIDGWFISIGFVSVGSSPVGDWIDSVKDIDNGFLLYVDGRRFKASGPGAGHVTVDAMIEGAYRVLKIRP